MYQNQVIVTTPIELQSLIRESIIDALSSHQISSPAREPPPSKEFLNIQETAEYLNLAVPTIYTLVSKRKIPSIKRGKKLHFIVSQLRDYLENGTRKTKNELIKDN